MASVSSLQHSFLWSQGAADMKRQRTWKAEEGQHWIYYHVSTVRTQHRFHEACRTSAPATHLQPSHHPARIAVILPYHTGYREDEEGSGWQARRHAGNASQKHLHKGRAAGHCLALMEFDLGTLADPDLDSLLLSLPSLCPPLLTLLMSSLYHPCVLLYLPSLCPPSLFSSSPFSFGCCFSLIFLTSHLKRLSVCVSTLRLCRHYICVTTWVAVTYLG